MERNGIILKDKELYTIGEVGRICGISAKALRYYGIQIGRAHV